MAVTVLLCTWILYSFFSKIPLENRGKSWCNMKKQSCLHGVVHGQLGMKPHTYMCVFGGILTCCVCIYIIFFYIYVVYMCVFCACKVGHAN